MPARNVPAMSESFMVDPPHLPMLLPSNSNKTRDPEVWLTSAHRFLTFRTGRGHVRGRPRPARRGNECRPRRPGLSRMGERHARPFPRGTVRLPPRRQTGREMGRLRPSIGHFQQVRIGHQNSQIGDHHDRRHARLPAAPDRRKCARCAAPDRHGRDDPSSPSDAPLQASIAASISVAISVAGGPVIAGCPPAVGRGREVGACPRSYLVQPCEAESVAERAKSAEDNRCYGRQARPPGAP